MLRAVVLSALLSLVTAEHLKGETVQSSVYSFNGTRYSSLRAVDNDMSTCAHTLDLPEPWWTIDLLGVYDIFSITFLQSDHHHADMTNARFYVGNSRENNGTANQLVEIITQYNNTGENQYRFESQVSGRYITIALPGTRFLILCEVYILGTLKVSPFVLVAMKKTWEEALYHCREAHSDLASILDQQDQAWAELEARKSSTTLVWLGLRYTCTLDFWFWVDDNTLGLNYWDEDPVEECNTSIAMETGNNHRWFGKSDNEEFNFICAI